MLTYKDLLFTGPEAVCMLDAELKIKQHNQNLSLLLGHRNEKLTGRHLSSILHDDMLIRHLLSSDSSSGWFQGECTLRMSTDHPLVVRFRAGPVVEEELSLVHREITDITYDPSKNRFLPYSSRSTRTTTASTSTETFGWPWTPLPSRGEKLPAALLRI